MQGTSPTVERDGRTKGSGGRGGSRRQRAFARIKAIFGLGAPLALIVLTGSAQESQKSGGVMGQAVGANGSTGVGQTGSTGPGTTGNTTTTGSATTGSTGTTGDDPAGTPINIGHILRIEEIRSTRSARVSSGAIVTDLNRHVLRLKFRVQAYQDSAGYSWHGRAVAIEAAPNGIGEIGSADSPATPAVVEAGTDHMFANPQNIYGHDGFDLRGYLVTRPPAGTNTFGEWDCYPQIGSAGTLLGGQIRLRLVLERFSAEPNETRRYLLESVLDLSKLACEAISLDSRKSYGQPNLGGVLSADPNAGLEHISFNGWTYKGGGFVGYMPGGTNDLSGEGRLQVRYTGTLPTSTYIGACLTAFPTERRAAYGTQSSQTAMQPAIVGLYRPQVASPADPNLNVGLGVKWGTRWNIVPQSAATSPVDYSKNAYHRFEITDAMQKQYANWQMPYKSPAANPPVTEMWRYAALALPDLSRTTWQSFATEPYQSIPDATFPITDSAIRIWRVGQVSSDNGYLNP